MLTSPENAKPFGVLPYLERRASPGQKVIELGNLLVWSNLVLLLEKKDAPLQPPQHHHASNISSDTHSQGALREDVSKERQFKLCTAVSAILNGLRNFETHGGLT